MPTLKKRKVGIQMSRKYWTVQELADEWRVSCETVRRLIRDNRLFAKSIGRCYRIPDETVKNYVR
jgi:excisionase family DNA binding protein